MAQTLRDWITATVEESQWQWYYIQNQTLDDSFGWGATLSALLPRMAGGYGTPKEQKVGCGLLLTGPQGCGKHTAAAHLMSQLEKDGYQLLFLNSLSLADADLNVVLERLGGLLQHFEEQHQSLCLHLEDMESCPYHRQVLTFLGQQLRNYKLSGQEEQKLFVILIHSREEELPGILRSQLLLCRMQLPALSQRAGFLKARGKDLAKALSLDVFAQETQGATFAQLADMLSAVNWYLDARGLSGLTDDQLTAFLRSQMPVPTQAQSLEKLVQALPELLARPVAAAEPVLVPPEPVHQPREFNEADFRSQREREIQDMNSYELIGQLFSQETIDSILTQ